MYGTSGRRILLLGAPLLVDAYVLVVSKTIRTTRSAGRNGPGSTLASDTFLIAAIGLVLYLAAPLVEHAPGVGTRPPTDGEKRVAVGLVRGIALCILYGWAFHIVKRFAGV